ncbi:MAG: dihydrodipicolinate reductase [Acidobacteria bacterium]|nr:MAG: dihydrodipicolinate reductase [Acidobacteriota bacterium]
MTRILIIGHGRMGQLVERHAAEHRCQVAGVIRRGDLISAAAHADVAIDFSTAEAVASNLVACADAGINVVIGTTGWQAREAELRRLAATYQMGVLASANFAVGLHIFRIAVARAAAQFAAQPSYDAWINDVHHVHKKDAPSGTALLLKDTMTRAGYARDIAVTSERVGEVPGTHTVGFDGPADTVTFTHTVRDRAVFAHGALDAARWLHGRRGWFSMDDLLEARSSWHSAIRGPE